jgi:CBS domain-containing protein
MDHNLAAAPPSTAADVMTAAVVSAHPESSVSDVAKLLLDARISAVPVLDGSGALLGMVSEGDLLGRSTEGRLAGQEWWLSLLSGPGQLEASVTEAAAVRRVQDVMHKPVLTVGPDTPLRDVAELLRSNAIKRVPVVREGLVVGIVSRADLLRAMEAAPPTAKADAGGGWAEMIGSFFTGVGGGTPAATERTTAKPAVIAPTAEGFRHLVDVSAQAEVDEKKAVVHAADLARIKQVKAVLHDHLGAEMWDALLAHARVAAAYGAKEIELIRFPSEACSDSGRKINIVDPTWPETLRGEAAEVHARWLRDLKPAGFGLVARVIDFPHGMPGNIALVLVWKN